LFVFKIITFWNNFFYRGKVVIYVFCTRKVQRSFQII
jgi:hypothetical protein